ncbi:MAG: hypothetical protein CMG67_01440 [Candidatus Marinimicrobia bacterium]|nr:hypothetical protein [Candidatus Neomarinimicrobiota bacterium]|tara:strand:+ start:6296 stop:6913 length:618 start_codon:yes stop_codon:yes gene_type:complete
MNDQINEKRSIFDIIKSNLKIIISLILLILISLVIYAWIENSANKKRANLSEQYIDAKIFLSEKNESEALKILEEIIDKKDSTYSVLSLYLIIDRDLQKNGNKILDYYNKVISINSLKKDDLDLLKFKKAVFISYRSDEKEILELLNPIINSDSVWKTQTIKFLADFYFSKKEFNKANLYYSQLLESENSNLNRKEIEQKIKNKK